MRIAHLVGATIVAAMFVLGCSGADGKPGANGKDGTNGSNGTNGTNGTNGNNGTNGQDVDGGIPVGCLQPCHGFNGIVEQYKTSEHFYVALQTMVDPAELPSWTGGGACGGCHAIDGIEQRVAGNVTTNGVPVPANVKLGQVDYFNDAGPLPGSGLGEVGYAQVKHVAQVHCTTCHTVNNQTDPHLIGGLYQKNQFAQRVPTVDAGPLIEKSPDNTAVTGTMVKFMGNSNTCGWCHKSRKDVTNYIKATGNNISQYWGPHEAGQLDVFSAKGAYHFPSKNYSSNAKHLTDLKCTDCHMPPVTLNSNYPNHSFNPQLSACQSCHQGLKTFDNGGMQQLTKLLLAELQGLLNTAGWLSRDGATALTPAQLADGQYQLDRGRSATGLTADQAGALYNYFLISRGSGFGVHNPVYVKQVMFDSISLLKGSAPAALSVRPN